MLIVWKIPTCIQLVWESAIWSLIGVDSKQLNINRIAIRSNNRASDKKYKFWKFNSIFESLETKLQTFVTYIRSIINV